MRSSFRVLLVALLAIGPLSKAGEMATEPMGDQAVLATQPSDFEVSFIMPGWLAGTAGTVGIKGLETNVSASFRDLLANLDMIGAGTIEARKGKLGFIIDGLYLKASVGGSPPGPLLSNVSVSLEQVLAEGTLTYRFFENDRAWIEFIAGARMIYLNTELSLTVDPAGARTVSENLSARIVDRATTAARDEVARRLPALVDRLTDKAADLKAKAVDDLKGRVSERVDDVRDRIRDLIDQGVGAGDPGYGTGIAGGGAIRDILRDYVNAKVDAELEAARARASEAVAEARARIRRELERKLAKVEAKLAKAIEKQIKDRIPNDPLSASKSWVDPFVGFRGRCQLWEHGYLLARGDVGGFGVSSDLTLNLFGALGVDLTQHSALELGYRYFSMDYRSGGFVYDMATKGPYVGFRYDF
ncbi:MAG: hypothetical protein WBE58_07075 [Verrucomicrobiales bacterium]|nr:hypothetical protein [Verrucomicrobiales bacterium]